MECHGFWTEFVVRFTERWFCGILFEERIFGLSSVKDSVAKKIRFDGEKMGIFHRSKRGESCMNGAENSYASLTFQETELLFLTLLISREFKAAYFLRQEPFWWNITIQLQDGWKLFQPFAAVRNLHSKMTLAQKSGCLPRPAKDIIWVLPNVCVCHTPNCKVLLLRKPS